MVTRGFNRKAPSEVSDKNKKELQKNNNARHIKHATTNQKI
jgi:hypothetical protein